MSSSAGQIPARELKTLSCCVQHHATTKPDAVAYYLGDDSLSWQAYYQYATRLALLLADLPLQRGQCIGVVLPDSFELHITLLALERAGFVAMAIGPRAGLREVRHLLSTSEAVALVSFSTHRDTPAGELASDLAIHVVVDKLLHNSISVNDETTILPAFSEDKMLSLDARSFAENELFLLNSTSGTTGMPKCVAHSSHRWFYYHQLLLETANFSNDDVFMSCISGTFGFGLWTSRFSPTILGVPCVILRKFSPEDAIAEIFRRSVTVLAAVSTQFILMLASPAMRAENFVSLQYLYTGGESVPKEKSSEFENVSGALVLQFYGSNETGALSATRESDSLVKRLGTAGRPFPQMQVRLYDSHGKDVTESGYGRAACLGAANCLGYFNDEQAQQELFTEDGWMLTGDYVRIDEAGYLHVEGRAGDFIIRGGKNISALAVEEAVLTIPNVRVAAAIAVPDSVFGERVAIVVELKDREQLLTKEGLRDQLQASGFSVEIIPELLYVVDAMPLSSGGKIAKGALRSQYGC